MGLTPERKEIVNGHKITEYYWAGDMVVYVDNQKSELTFSEAVAQMKDSEAPND